jgi:hypothetical protein
MATALAYLFSDNGFVIAADGRDTLVSAEGREVASDHAQKIFPIRGIDREAAFSFTGRTTFYDQAEERIAFDFISQFVDAANRMQSETVMNAGDFLSRVCSAVRDKLEFAKRSAAGISKFPSPRNRLNPSEHTIIDIHIDGYFSSYPARVGATFYHINQKVAWDLNSPHTLNSPKIYWNVLDGSALIGTLLFDTDDVRLAQYRTEACCRVAAHFRDPNIGITLADGIEAARNYIAACSDPAIREIDPENCQRIGGHIHIATITLQDGFRWAIAPMLMKGLSGSW